MSMQTDDGMRGITHEVVQANMLAGDGEVEGASDFARSIKMKQAVAQSPPDYNEYQIKITAQKIQPDASFNSTNSKKECVMSQ